MGPRDMNKHHLSDDGQREFHAPDAPSRIINLQAEDGSGPILTVRVTDESEVHWRAEVIEAKCEPLTFMRCAWREVTP